MSDLPTLTRTPLPSGHDPRPPLPDYHAIFDLIIWEYDASRLGAEHADRNEDRDNELSVAIRYLESKMFGLLRLIPSHDTDTLVRWFALFTWYDLDKLTPFEGRSRSFHIAKNHYMKALG